MEERHSLLFDYLSFKREPDENETIIISCIIKEEYLLDEDSISAGIFQILLDTAIGTAVSEAVNGFAATLQLNTNIFDTSRKDIYICHAKTSLIGAKLAYGEGKIVDGSGNLLAAGQASFKLIPLKK